MSFSYNMEKISFTDITPLSFSLTDYPSKHIQEKASHHYYSMFFLIEGNAVFILDNQVYNLNVNEGIIIFPEVSFSFTIPENKTAKLGYVSFYGIRTDDFIERLTINPAHPVFLLPENSNILQYFKNTNSTPLGSNFLALSLIYKVFAFTYNQTYSSDESYFSEAIEYIDSNISQPIKVQEIANSLGISRVYLYKIFEDTISVSPKEYITNRKLFLAYEMLKNKHTSISATANAVGYSDQFAFSKLFKAKYLLSPKEILKGKTPYVCVLDDENGEYLWPSEITTERSKNGKYSLVANPYFDEKKNNIEGWLLRAGYIRTRLLPRTLDISLVTDNGRNGALSFWIFVENMCDITDWTINAKDWIRFGSSPDWDTDFQYWLNWHDQIKVEGWNKIILPFGDSSYGHVVGNPNYKKFCSFGMILSVPKHIRIFIDDIKVIPNI